LLISRFSADISRSWIYSKRLAIDIRIFELLFTFWKFAEQQLTGCSIKVSFPK
jgi:hypothetical protein